MKRFDLVPYLLKQNVLKKEQFNHTFLPSYIYFATSRYLKKSMIYSTSYKDAYSQSFLCSHYVPKLIAQSNCNGKTASQNHILVSL